MMKFQQTETLRKDRNKQGINHRKISIHEVALTAYSQPSMNIKGLTLLNFLEREKTGI